MTEKNKEYLQKIIAAVAKSCQLSDWCYSVQSFEAKGQNYFGELIPVTLQGKTEKSEVNCDIVLKLAPTDERFRVSGALTQFFAREIYVYSNIINRYTEIVKGLCTCDFVSPKCYYVCADYCKEAIVLQDMRTESYKPYLDAFLDVHHILLSLKALAQFHALSFILKAKDQLTYEEINKTCVPLTEKNNKRFMIILEDRLTKAINHLKNTEYEQIFSTLLKNQVEFVESVAYSVNATCICHGDIWKENILFKYKNNLPISACLIDYQTAKICSPAYDVLYLIASSTRTALRQSHFNQLLDTYYQTFQQTLSESGLVSEEIYSNKMFLEDLSNVGPGVLIVVNTAIWLSSGLQQEGHVRSKIILKTENEKIAAMNTYTSLLKEIVNDFKKYGYLTKLS